MIDENFIEFCCLDKLVERRDAIQVTFFESFMCKFYYLSNTFCIKVDLRKIRILENKLHILRKCDTQIYAQIYTLLL